MDFKRAGTIAWRRGDLDEAARCFDAAICDDVQDWESIAALASLCLDQGKLGQAYALYANAARIDPTNAAILADIGRVLIAWGEYEDALPIFERAHRIDPHNLAAINNAAMACINLGALGRRGAVARMQGATSRWNTSLTPISHRSTGTGPLST
jgi:tetratricopeptide (TPR) repeat protein